MKGWTQNAVNQLALAGPDGTAEPSILRTNRTNTGKEFEKEMERTFGYYQSNRIATVRKVDPPVRLIYYADKVTGEKKTRAIFLPNPFLDFVGSWSARHGRALFVECKSSAAHRLPLRPGHLSDDQVNAMKTWRLAGAAVCILWQWAGRVALITPEMVIGAKGRGEKSIAFEGLPLVPRGEGSCIWDFLPILEGICFAPIPPSVEIESEAPKMY